MFFHTDATRSEPGAAAALAPGERFRTVLVVDDDDKVCAALEKALSRHRVVYVTHKSQDAMRIARTKRPDLAVVDLQLGTESGIDLVAGLRRRYPQLTIVLMTGYGSVDAAVAAMRAGADDVIAKPFTTPELLRRAAGMSVGVDVETPSLARALWEHCDRVLRNCEGNKSLAARALKMHRSRLRRILAKGPPP